MLIVRFKETFRHRQMEWALAGMATGWGAILIQNPEAFDKPFYAPLANMAHSPTWGWGIFLCGAWGMVVLFINGSWRRTPFWRSICSAGRILVWTALLFGCLSAVGQTPASMVYAGLVFMEIMSLSNATVDGQRIKSGTTAHGS